MSNNFYISPGSSYNGKNYNTNFLEKILKKNNNFYLNKSSVGVLNNQKKTNIMKIENYLTIYNERCVSQKPKTQKKKYPKPKKALQIISQNDFYTGLPVLQIQNFKYSPPQEESKVIPIVSQRKKFLSSTRERKIPFKSPCVLTKSSNNQIKKTYSKPFLNNLSMVNKPKDNISFTRRIRKVPILSSRKNESKSYKLKLSKIEHITVPGTKLNSMKINQDSFLILNNINDNKSYNIFGVFDGHGDNGDIISKKTSEYFEGYYLKNSQSDKELIYNELISNNYEYIKFSFESAYNNLRSEKIETKASGTTCNLIYLIDTKIICSNLGDSRCIAVKDNNSIIPLSFDHKPERIEEKTRIENAGGEIARVNWANFGPFRIWFKGENYPGLAMSRSFGDDLARQIGVISDPEINEIDYVTERIKFVVLATDGVWEFLSNETVKDIVSPFYDSGDCKGAVKKLSAMARKTWEVNNKMGIDDITIIILFFE